MEQYRRVEKQKVEDQIKENEIRVTTQGKMRSFISYATTLLKEKGFSEIVLKAMGRAINKTVTIAEIIKRRIPNLHQITEIDSTDITDVWEPLQEGLDRLEMTRHVSSIQIRLSTAELDTTSPGYQPPLPQDQVKPVDEETTAALEIEVGEKPRRRGRGRGRGRGRSEEHGEEQESHETHTALPRRNNNTNAVANNNNNTEETGSGERGRRGGRGARRGRGGFVGDKTRPSRTHGAEGEAQGTEYGDRNDQAPSSFRGRGRRGGRGGARFSEHGEGEADQGPSFRRGRRGGRGGFGDRGDGAARFSEHADGEAEQGSFRRGRRGGFRGNRGDGAARFSEQHGEGETDQGTSFRGRGRGGFRGTRGRGFGRGARGDRGGRDTSQNTQQ